MSIELVMLPNHPILCCSLHLLISIIFIIKVLSNKSPLHIRWPKLKYQHQSCWWIFRVDFLLDWLVGLLAVYGTLKSLHQHQFESIKSSALSLLYGPIFTCIHVIGKAIALIRHIFVSKVTSLLFNTLPKFVFSLLPRSKHLLISWLQSPSTVILEARK